MLRKTRVFFSAIILVSCCVVVSAQGKLDHLKSWEGKYPTTKKGRIMTKFFNAREIKAPLLVLLTRGDFNLLTKEYAVETPVKKIGNYLAVKVCKPHICFENAAFAVNLNTGDIYVRFATDESERWFASKGNAERPPAAVKEYMEDFSAT